MKVEQQDTFGFGLTSLHQSGFQFECCKTKTKLLQPIKEHRQYSEPLKTRSNYRQLTQSAGKCKRTFHELFTSGLGFTSDWMKQWREFFKPIMQRRKCKTINRETQHLSSKITYFQGGSACHYTYNKRPKKFSAEKEKKETRAKQRRKQEIM